MNAYGSGEYEDVDFDQVSGGLLEDDDVSQDDDDDGLHHHQPHVDFDDPAVAALPRVLLMGPRRSGKTSIQVRACVCVCQRTA